MENLVKQGDNCFLQHELCIFNSHLMVFCCLRKLRKPQNTGVRIVKNSRVSFGLSWMAEIFRTIINCQNWARATTRTQSHSPHSCTITVLFNFPLSQKHSITTQLLRSHSRRLMPDLMLGSWYLNPICLRLTFLFSSLLLPSLGGKIMLKEKLLSGKQNRSSTDK